MWRILSILGIAVPEGTLPRMDINWQKHGVEALSYLKGIGNKVKQVALQLTEMEVKVEDATNNEPWGPHGKDMAGEQANIALIRIHHQETAAGF